MIDPPPANSRLNRRGFLKIIAASGLAVGLGGVLAREWLEHGANGFIHETRWLMGTAINLSVFTLEENQGKAAVQAAFSEMERLIAILDHRKPEAALARLNRDGEISDPPQALVVVIRKALEIGALTGGAFDITVKPALDAIQAGNAITEEIARLVDYRQIAVQDRRIRLGRPGMALTLDGLAKGSVVDGGIGILRQYGFDNILVEAGGDLAAQGCRPDGDPWQVGILHPRDPQQSAFYAISLQDLALATSGDYQHRFSTDYTSHHILDPHTLLSPPELACATAIAATAMEADAWSTSLMAMGSQNGLALIEHLPHTEALLVSKSLEIHRSSGFPSNKKPSL